MPLNKVVALIVALQTTICMVESFTLPRYVRLRNGVSSHPYASFSRASKKMKTDLHTEVGLLEMDCLIREILANLDFLEKYVSNSTYPFLEKTQFSFTHYRDLEIVN